jgi:serine/threonine protein kinase
VPPPPLLPLCLPSAAAGAPDISALHAEVQILHAIRHQHVVRLYQVYDERDVMWIVQVRASGRERDG